MPLEFKLEGIKELRDTVSAIRSIGGDRRLKRIAEGAAKLLYDEMVRRAPYDPKRRRGVHLRDAIFIGLGPAEHANVLVGVNLRKAPHGMIVEYGSRVWRGKPYFRPSIELLRDRVTQIVQQGLESLLAEKWEGKHG